MHDLETTNRTSSPNPVDGNLAEGSGDRPAGPSADRPAGKSASQSVDHGPDRPSPAVGATALTRRGLLGRLAAAGPLAWIIAACGGNPGATDWSVGTGSDVAPGGVDATRAIDDADAADEAAETGASDAIDDADATEPPEGEAVAEAPTLEPTPACADDDDPTPPQTEGPFYTPDTPERASFLEAGVAGTTLTIAGRVLGTDCRPIAGALLDFWHADADGNYDNVGYRMRGHQFADSDGSWRLETILPAVYTGRTRHIHVRVQPPGGQILTTQLYFPGEPANARDGIYQPELELTMTPDAADGSRFGSFDFVLPVG